MPFDGFSPERTPPAPAGQESLLLEAQTRAQQAETQLHDAENDLELFFVNALSGERLSADQKNLLGQLRTDQRVDRLHEVVHADDSGQYAFKDYFGEAEDVLTAAEKLIRTREQASDAHVAAIRAVETLKHPPVESSQVMPTLERAPMPVPKKTETREAFESRFQHEWEAYRLRVDAHLQNIKESYFHQPINMPFSETSAIHSETPGDAFAISTETPNDPFAAQTEVMPASPHIETPPDPAAYAGPTEPTVMMPAADLPPAPAPKKRNVFSSLFS